MESVYWTTAMEVTRTPELCNFRLLSCWIQHPQRMHNIDEVDILIRSHVGELFVVSFDLKCVTSMTSWGGSFWSTRQLAPVSKA